MLQTVPSKIYRSRHTEFPSSSSDNLDLTKRFHSTVFLNAWNKHWQKAISEGATNCFVIRKNVKRNTETPRRYMITILPYLLPYWGYPPSTLDLANTAKTVGIFCMGMLVGFRLSTKYENWLLSKVRIFQLCGGSVVPSPLPPPHPHTNKGPGPAIHSWAESHDEYVLRGPQSFD